MIEERINNSLKELEQGLKDVESARKQVEKTVNSYDGLTRITGDYVTKLGNVNEKVKELVNVVGKDYDQKVKDFEKDMQAIVSAANAASEKLATATEEFKDSLSEIKTKLKYSLIVNGISLFAIIVIIILLMK